MSTRGKQLGSKQEIVFFKKPISFILALLLAFSLLPSSITSAWALSSGGAATSLTESEVSIAPSKEGGGQLALLEQGASEITALATVVLPYQDLVLSPGGDTSELRFTWYTSQATGQIAIREAGT